MVLPWSDNKSKFQLFFLLTNALWFRETTKY